MKQVNAQEEQVLKMMKHSTSLFPERKEYQKIDDAAIGWAHRKRKTNPKIDSTNMPIRMSLGGTTDS